VMKRAPLCKPQKKVNSKDEWQEQQEEDEWQNQELIKQITKCEVLSLVKVTKLENLCELQEKTRKSLKSWSKGEMNINTLHES
jgi:hypothetical protein